jgi:SNF2 family DNA or RNA helicase
MITPKPHQVEGGLWLAKGGLILADQPRVGKTGASIIGADLCLYRKILVVTTASNRANFGRDFREWQAFPRKVQVLFSSKDRIAPDTDVAVVAWSTIIDPCQKQHLIAWGAELCILDEFHYGKSITAQRTVAAIQIGMSAQQQFLLSGTPMPNSPVDLYAMLKAFAPHVVADMTYDQYFERYAVYKRKWVAGEMKKIVLRGKNEQELKQRLDGLWLRRTQQDVGITEPIYSVLALDPSAMAAKALRDALAHLPEADEILDAVETGDTAALEHHLGTLRRVTAVAKAHAVADVVKEEIEDGKMDRVVLMCWHTEAIDTLAKLLHKYNPVILDGRTPAAKRGIAVETFQTNRSQVFLGQMLAAGEAIDLSLSRDLIFVESSFTPKDMKQAALRVTNFGQTGRVLVRVAALAGSIDEAVTAVLTRKVASIAEVLQ